MDQIRDLQGRVLLDMQERQLTAQLFEQSSLKILVRKLQKEKPADLLTRLRDKNPIIRFVVIEAIARRHLPLEEDLLQCFQDNNAAVRAAAHRALVRICRDTDWGPFKEGDARLYQSALPHWQHWLQLQEAAPPALARSPVDTSVPVRKAKADAVDPRLEDAATAALVKEVLAAPATEQSNALQRLKAGKGVQYSDALALVIPRLAPSLQEQARQMLAERLARMKAGTLRDKMHEEDGEVRCAAARACVLKTAVENIEDLIELLQDSQPAVVQAAHTALDRLTGQDFGPPAQATARQRREAVQAWRAWLRHRDRPDR